MAGQWHGFHSSHFLWFAGCHTEGWQETIGTSARWGSSTFSAPWGFARIFKNYSDLHRGHNHLSSPHLLDRVGTMKLKKNKIKPLTDLSLWGLVILFCFNFMFLWSRWSIYLPSFLPSILLLFRSLQHGSQFTLLSSWKMLLTVGDRRTKRTNCLNIRCIMWDAFCGCFVFFVWMKGIDFLNQGVINVRGTKPLSSWTQEERSVDLLLTVQTSSFVFFLSFLFFVLQQKLEMINYNSWISSPLGEFFNNLQFLRS